jgi:hypothetical protein
MGIEAGKKIFLLSYIFSSADVISLRVSDCDVRLYYQRCRLMDMIYQNVSMHAHTHVPL